MASLAAVSIGFLLNLPAFAEPAAEPTPVPASGSDVSAQDLDDINQLFGGSDSETTPAPTASSPDPTSVPRFFQSMNPDISFILDTAGAAFSSDTPLQLGGHDPKVNGFNLQQLEMSLGSAVDPFFRFDGNVVFSPFGVEIEEAYATTSSLPANLQLRAGQFLTRFGRVNATHPHTWDFVDQPLVIGKFFGSEGNRGLGTELSWLAPLPWYLEVIGSLTDAGGEATARSFWGRNNLGVSSPADLQATTVVKQFFPLNDDWALSWGLSGAFGPNPTGRSNRTDLFGSDVYLRYRPLTGDNVTIVTLTGETLLRRRQVPGDVLVDAGGLLSLMYQFGLGWATALRYEAVSGTAKDYLDPDWTGNRQRLSANVSWWPTEYSRIRLQGNADFPAWRNEPIYAAFLAFEVVTGAHGAHKF
jgi:hypothetical protein